jgi:Holliday junction resolvase RusA-like endonuclease
MIRYNSNAIAKPRMTQADSWKKRPIVLRYWEYKDNIKNWAHQNNFNLGNEIYAIFYIAMPKSWSIKKKELMIGKNHQQRPDIDNLLKGLMDALLEEDSHIHTVYSKKVWSDKAGIEFFDLKNISIF